MNDNAETPALPIFMRNRSDCLLSKLTGLTKREGSYRRVEISLEDSRALRRMNMRSLLLNGSAAIPAESILFEGVLCFRVRDGHHVEQAHTNEKEGSR